MIKSTSSGEVHSFDDFAILHRWIVEHRVSRDDLLSRTGEQWRALGTIAELAPFFQTALQLPDSERVVRPLTQDRASGSRQQTQCGAASTETISALIARRFAIRRIVAEAGTRFSTRSCRNHTEP